MSGSIPLTKTMDVLAYRISLIDGVGYAVSNAVLSSNVVTLTTSAAHDLEPGDQAWVRNVGSPYDGEWTVSSVPTSTTFTYELTHANVASASVSGSVSSRIAEGRRSFPDDQSPEDAILELDDQTECWVSFWVSDRTSNGQTQVSSMTVEGRIYMHLPNYTTSDLTPLYELADEVLGVCQSEAYFRDCASKPMTGNWGPWQDDTLENDIATVRFVTTYMIGPPCTSL